MRERDAHGEVGLRCAADDAAEQARSAAAHALVGRRMLDRARREEEDAARRRRLDPGPCERALARVSSVSRRREECEGLEGGRGTHRGSGPGRSP